MHGIWIVSLIGMVLVFVFGNKAVQRQVSDIYLVRTLGLLALGLVLIAIAGLLALAAWWQKPGAANA